MSLIHRWKRGKERDKGGKIMIDREKERSERRGEREMEKSI